jgi:hypothetical protein
MKNYYNIVSNKLTDCDDHINKLKNINSINIQTVADLIMISYYIIMSKYIDDQNINSCKKLYENSDFLQYKMHSIIELNAIKNQIINKMNKLKKHRRAYNLAYYIIIF